MFNSDIDSLATVLFIGAGQGFVLAAILLTIRRGNRIANRLLAVILCFFSASITLHTLSRADLLFRMPYHKGIILIFYLLIAPLFYFYVKALTNPDFKLPKKDLVHFSPLTFGLLLTFFQKPAQFHSKGEPDEGINMVILAFLVIILTIIYLTLAIKALLQHAKKIREAFSSIEKINLGWLRFLIIGYVITWLAAISAEGHGGGAESWNYYWILVSVFMYAIGYMGLRQPEIFSGTFLENLTTDQTGKGERTITKKYEKSTLTREQAEVYFKRLQQMVVEDRPYLESNITLPELAKSLSISTHHLSQIINERLQQNFFEFVNSLRVEDAKKMLTEQKNWHITIAAIAFEVGFNSISAFNTAFKKHTGMTPSQFRELIKGKN